MALRVTSTRIIESIYIGTMFVVYVSLMSGIIGLLSAWTVSFIALVGIAVGASAIVSTNKLVSQRRLQQAVYASAGKIKHAAESN